MKLLCVIVSLWVMVLSTIPCCADEECDDRVAAEQTEHQEETCEGCSPFLLCGSCAGFTFSHVSFVFQLPVNENLKVVTPFAIASIANCFVEVWQPPKLG